MAGKWHTRTGRISLSPHLPVGIPAWEICHLKCWYFSQAHSWDICCVCMHEAITFSLIQIYILFSNPYYSFFLLLFSPVWQIHWIFLSKHFPQLHLSFHKCLAFLLNAWLSSLTTYFVNSITARRASQSHPATSADRSYEHGGKDWNVEYMSLSILSWAI